MDFEREMLAYCGLYCLSCSFRVTFETQNTSHVAAMPARYDHEKEKPWQAHFCPGCKGENSCGPCNIRDCARAKKLSSCADCGDFPCQILLDFEADAKVLHHQEAVANLRLIRQHGVDNWFVDVEKKLACSCGERQSWYLRCEKHPKND